MSRMKRILLLLVALFALVRSAPIAKGWGFNYSLPPHSVSVTSEKRSNIFYVGQPVVLNVSGPAAWFEVRDYYGTLVDSNTIVGSSFRPQVTDPGWYKVYVYGSIDQGPPWGQIYGGTMFCVFRNKAGFPGLPGPDSNAYFFVDDEALRGVTGMGPQRHYVNDASNPAADIARLREEIAVDQQMYLPWDPVRKRSLMIAFPNGTAGNLAGVSQVVNAFKGVVRYFEPRNEPNFGSSGSDFVTKELIPFYQTVKAADSSAKVLGPGVVTIGPYGLNWMDDFFEPAGGTTSMRCRFIATITSTATASLRCIHWSSWMLLLAKYNLAGIEKWQTEQGYMAAA